MSKQIKMRYAEIESVLSTLKTSVTSMKSDFSKEISGDNAIELITSANELNKNLQILLENYRALLLQNEQLTQLSVESMRKTDSELATLIK